MIGVEGLPRAKLRPAGPVTARLLALGVETFEAAADHVRRLPYGRNSDRDDFQLVLSERRGTCSTKHALLAALALEQGLDVALCIGIYEMTGRNTPGVGPALERHGLPHLPEAHCYLICGGRRIDVTRAGAEPEAPIDRFLYEERIEPAKIGRYKTELHERFLRGWAAESEQAGGRSFEDLWSIREECIAALHD